MVGEGEEATAEGGGGDGGEASPSQAHSATMEVEAESRAVVLGRRVMANKQVLSIEEGRKGQCPAVELGCFFNGESSAWKRISFLG